MTKGPDREHGMKSGTLVLRGRKTEDRGVKSKSTFLPNIASQASFLCWFLRETSSWRPGDSAGEMPLNSTEAPGKHPNRGEEGGEEGD